MSTQITAVLPTLNFPREVDYPTQEDWAAFSAAAELNFGILGGDWSAQMQLWKTEANTMSTEVNNNATIAQGLADYQGDWVSQGYTLGQTVSIDEVYYICKLTHSTGQNPTDSESLYWNLAIGNWNLKVDTNMSGYISKTTPVDTDLIPLSDSVSSFALKKLTLANLKTYTSPSSSETVAGIIELATTAESQAGTDNLRAITALKLFNSLKGSNQNLATNGYQKLHGGLIIQWGTSTGVTTVNAFQLITTPISFPTACLFACGSSQSLNSYGGAGKSGATGVAVWGNNIGTAINYIAIGH